MAKVDEGMDLQLLLQNYKDEMLITVIVPDIEETTISLMCGEIVILEARLKLVSTVVS